MFEEEEDDEAFETDPDIERKSEIARKLGIEYQFRPDWLGHQSLDIFVPDLNIGIEYQGAQHYIPITLFGGEDGLKERIKLDRQKKRICEDHGIVVIEWKYTDPLTDNAIKLGKQKYEAMSGEPEETSGSPLIVKKSITNDRRIDSVCTRTY